MAAHQTIGFIGLGQMGYPMAAHVAAQGAELTIFDARADVTAKVAREIGAHPAGTISEVGERASVVMLSLPNGQVVHDVVLGDEATDGLVDSLESGAIIVDMSSSEPNGTRSLGDSLLERGVHLLDAPVSGGVKKAVSGALTIMIGGEQTAIETVAWLFEGMGEKQFRTGPLGSGHAMKALNNYVSAAGLTAASDAVRIGSAFGLEPELIVDILNVSTGRNNSTENKFHQFILSENFDSGFSMALMAKDIRTAANLAHESDLVAPLLDQCSALWSQASCELGSSADHTEIPKFRGDAKEGPGSSQSTG